MAPRSEERNLQWIDITDFTPGIYQRSERVLADAAIPAPLGAAQVTNTFRCQALPTGGLAPLPGRTKSWNIPSPGTGDNGIYVNGFYAFGPLSPATTYLDEVFLGLEYVEATTRKWRFYRLRFFNNPASPNGFAALTNVDLLQVYNSTTGAAVNTRYWGMSFASDRINTVDATLPGVPVVATDYFDQGGSTIVAGRSMFTFPDPSTASVTAIFPFSTTPGQVIGHQGRLIQLQGIGYSHGAGEAVATNEQVSFTDPPNGPNMGTQNEVFSQENPTGYGAWGSISAGELFFVKHQGGGLIVSGDVANPSITRLPGVISSGGTISRAVSTPQGLFYISNRVGVCVWRGGDTSEVVSEQLDGDFYLTSFGSPFTASGTFMNGVSASLESWGPWVLVSNNWLYNTITHAWWRIEDPATVAINWWSKSFDARYMWGATPTYTLDTIPVVHLWDQFTPATNYSWQSHPIPATQNRLIEVRDIVVVAQGSGTVTVTLTAFDGTTQAETFNVTNATQPQRLRPAQGGTFIKGYNVVVRIQADSTTTAPAPVVHALHLGTRPAQPVVAT